MEVPNGGGRFGGHDGGMSDAAAERTHRVGAVGAYPNHWEADVVLADGRPVHLRPILPDDGPALQDFHHRLSAQSVYFRFFTLKPELTEADLRRFTDVDYVDRVALVAMSGTEIIGVGGYDRIDAERAEVAFTVRDDVQGRGLGSAILEHLAAAAREHGVERFTAEVLPSNARMLATFREAGFVLSQHLEQDVIAVAFDIEPTALSRAVIAAREHRAEARSLRRLLNPSSIAVVGASRRPGTVGHALLEHLVHSGFTGSLVAVHPHAEKILGVDCVPSLRQVPGPVDLAVVAVPAPAVKEVLDDAAAAGVMGLVVVSGGFADSDEDGIGRQRELVAQARLLGIRIVGPNALGLVNTDPAIRMNASLVRRMPEPGRVGFFCQSGALGSSILERLRARGLGVSTFVSAGNRADVSGNDALQYWQDDESTEVVLLYLESMGNARKFARLVRRIAPAKPVLMVGSGGTAVPSGHVARRTELPERSVSALLEACGLVTLDGIDRMLDLAAVLASQPIPTASGIGIVGNSDALAVLAANAADRRGCQPIGAPVSFPRDASIDRYRAEVRASLAHPGVGAGLVIHVPPVEGPLDRALLAALIEEGESSGKPVVAVMQGHGPSTAIVNGIPVFVDVEDAIGALVAMGSLARWRAELAQAPAAPQDVDPEQLVELVQASLQDGHRTRHGPSAAQLLQAAGVRLSVGRRRDGPSCRITLFPDPLFGPVLSISLDDLAAIALGDISIRLAPLHLDHSRQAVRSLQALPKVLGPGANRTAEGDLVAAAIERYADVVHRISWLTTWCPHVDRVEIHGLHWDEGWTADRVYVELVSEPESYDPDARRMGG